MKKVPEVLQYTAGFPTSAIAVAQRNVLQPFTIGDIYRSCTHRRAINLTLDSIGDDLELEGNATGRYRYSTCCMIISYPRCCHSRSLQFRRSLHHPSTCLITRTGRSRAKLQCTKDMLGNRSQRRRKHAGVTAIRGGTAPPVIPTRSSLAALT